MLKLTTMCSEISKICLFDRILYDFFTLSLIAFYSATIYWFVSDEILFCRTDSSWEKSWLNDQAYDNASNKMQTTVKYSVITVMTEFINE